MSAKSYGTAFLYGVGGTIANAAVQSFKAASECKNTAAAEEENGNAVERRYDDVTDEGTIELKYRSTYTIPVAGSSTVVWMGSTYEVAKVNRSDTNRAHRIVSLDIVKSQYIDSTVSTTITTT